jgi:hypothetical protein
MLPQLIGWKGLFLFFGVMVVVTIFGLGYWQGHELGEHNIMYEMCCLSK